MEELNMYDAPTYAQKGTKILRPVWTYMVKHDGRKKARNCCNGSVLKGKGVEYEHTYASRASQIGMKLFTTIASLHNYIIIGTNATNAYVQSPPPTEPTFMCIDDQYADWYFNKCGTHLDRKMVLPVLHALQGHPESGALWERHVFAILKSLGFTTTTHERCLYCDFHQGKECFICHQVDNFKVAGPNKDTI
eukprot:12878492-Ditylum_brightwellii.AAC.1